MSESNENMVNEGDTFYEEVVDIEVYVKEGKIPPLAKLYRFRVDKEYIQVDFEEITGLQVLEFVRKDPQRFRLDMKLRGGATKKVALDETVHLRNHGIERFMTLPLDQTEG